MRFERLVDRAPHAIDFVEGEGDLVIAFASVGHDPGRAPSPEFVGTATAGGRRALFVTDASRSWGNDPGFAPALREAVAQVAARAPLGRVATVGLSMGAFCALVAAQIVPVDVVLAFGPQWSVLPGMETRWSRWTDALPQVQWPTAPIPACWTILMHGGVDDMAQSQPFPRQKGLDHLIFPALGHSGLVPHLKARGVLPGLMQAALQGDRRRLLRIAASAGGVRRLP